MFELNTPTKGKLLNLEVLSQKGRAPDENPGSQVKLAFTIGADLLVMFDGRIAGVLYEPSNGSQQALEGIQSLQLTALAKRLGSFRWKYDMVGYELTFDRGLGDAKSNLVLTDCKLDRWRLTPKDGGSIDVVVIAESSDTSAATFGQLAKLKSCEVSFTLTAAEVAQGDLGAAPAPARKTAKPKANDATSEFIERNTRPH